MDSTVAIYSKSPESLIRLKTALEETDLYQVEPFSQFMTLLDWCRTQSRPVTAFFLEGMTVDELALLKSLPVAENALVFDITPRRGREQHLFPISIGSFVDSLIVKPIVSPYIEEKVKSLINQRLGIKMSALVVDETNENRELVCGALSRCGFLTCLEAPNTQTAIEVLNENVDSIALLVISGEPPSQESLRLLAELKRSNRLSKVPFLIMTSREALMASREEEEVRRWMNRYFALPESDELLRIQVAGLEEIFFKRARLNAFLSEASVFIKRGERKHAIEILEHAVKLQIEEPLLLEKLGDLYSEDIETPRHLENAIATYQRVIKTHPDSRSSVLKCGELLHRLERHDELIFLYRNFLILWAFESSVRLRLAKIYMKKSDQSAACVELRRLLSLDPQHQEAISLLHAARALQDPILSSPSLNNAAS